MVISDGDNRVYYVPASWAMLSGGYHIRTVGSLYHIWSNQMSGGHYNYASSVYDLETMIRKLSDLAELGEDLGQFAPSSKAAADTAVLLILVDWLDKTITRDVNTLNRVWHALEWWQSCDWSEEQFKAAVDKYEKESNG